MNTTPTVPCDPRYNYPAPIAAWRSVVERLHSVAGGDGYKVITLTVIVDGDGRPAHWLEPNVKKLEPKGRAETRLAVLLDELSRV